LRALAVIAVVIYHFDPAALPGGFLGVDIFFVISGYLITRLITREFVDHRRIDTPAFYRRRARRLLPALAVVLVAITIAALFWRDQLAMLRPGVIFSALFSANWWLAFDRQPYFVATGRPTMLQHLWSLGVEEQFYLFWPVITAATLTAGRRAIRRRAREGKDTADAVRRITAQLAVIAVVFALMSTGLSWLLADLRNVPYGSDGSTLYYGTDTHCMGLLLGAALGAWTTGRRPGRRTARFSPQQTRAWLDVVGTAALLAVLILTRTYASYSHTLYRGGFLLIAALVTLVIGVATRSGSRLGTALEAPLLRWIGVRSYAIYLWHWPIAIVTRPGLDTSLPTWLDQTMRVALTLALANLTYTFIETPTRRLGLRGAIRAMMRSVRRAASPLARPAVAVLGVAPVLAAGILLIGPNAPRPAAALASHGGTNLSIDPATPPPPYVGPRQQPHATPAPPLPKISGFGDSVLLDARHTLAHSFGGGTIDAVVGRQPGQILNDVRRAERAHRLNPVVVIQAGNNGLINPSDLEATLQLLSRPSSTVRAVLVVNDHLDPYDRDWQTPNNATIDRVVPKFPVASVVNWNKAATSHRGWLYSDDLHLKPKGAIAYTRLLVSAYERKIAATGGTSR
jgi:peptidoglycan/LPS O-acetylase OafA/YrhL